MSSKLENKRPPQTKHRSDRSGKPDLIPYLVQPSLSTAELTMLQAQYHCYIFSGNFWPTIHLPALRRARCQAGIILLTLTDAAGYEETHFTCRSQP